MKSLTWTRIKSIGAHFAVAPDNARQPGARYLITRLFYFGPIKWELFVIADGGTRESLDTFTTLKEAKAVASDFAYWNTEVTA